MHRNWLLKKLQNYQPELPTQKDLCERFIAFVTEYPDCFERSLLIGHITGSAWILNPDRQKTALIHHKKLHKWVQPGGHSDGDPNTLEVARREGCEETGLTALTEISDEIFDLDIHEIPARPTEPRHWHYDVRFAFCANGNLDLHVNEEVSELGWFDLNEILKSDLEESVIRLARKKKKEFTHESIE